MLSKKFNTKNFNDGLLFYGDFKTSRDEKTGSKTGKKVFISKGDAFFEFENIRQDDFNQFEGKRNKTNLKVSTYFLPGVEESLKVKIENSLYEINKIDVTKDRKLMYWYLTKLGDLEDGVRFRESSNSNQTSD